MLKFATIMPPTVGSPTKILTFQLHPPKADIFLDLDAKSISNENYEKLSIYESNWDFLYNKFAQISHKLKSKSMELVGSLNSFLKPKLRKCQVLSELILCNLIALLSFPLILLWILLILSVRWGVGIYFKGCGLKNKYKLLDGIEASAARSQSENCAKHITTLLIIEGECSLDKIRARAKDCLTDADSVTSNETYRKMGSRIVEKFGFLCWEHLSPLNVENHINYFHLETNLKDEEEILKTIQSIPIPAPNFPQWQLHVIPKFRGSSGHYALIFKASPSILNGNEAFQSIYNIFLMDKQQHPCKELNSKPMDFQTKIKIFLYIFLFGPFVINKRLQQEENCFHGPQNTGVLSSIKTCRPISVQSIKQMKNVMGTSTTSLLLALFGGALRKLALKKNFPVPPFIVGVAVDDREKFVAVPHALKLKESCPIMRLRDTTDLGHILGKRRDLELCENVALVQNFYLAKLVGINPRKLIQGLMSKIDRATFLMVNFPGPETCSASTVFEGGKLIDVKNWTCAKGKTGITLSFVSYGGKMRLVLAVDEATLPNPNDVETLVLDFENEFSDLAKVCGISQELIFC